MSKTNISPHLGMAANLGRKPGTQVIRTQCAGQDVHSVCAERETCRLYQAWLMAPMSGAMLLPRVGGNACHYRIEAEK